MKKLGILLFLISVAAGAYSQEKLYGDFTMIMLGSAGEGRMHVGDNKKIDITVDGETSHAEFEYYREKDYLGLSGDSMPTMIFRVDYSEDHIDLFLQADSSPELAKSLVDSMNGPMGSGELGKMFTEKFAKKMYEIFDEVPFFRLYRVKY